MFQESAKGGDEYAVEPVEGLDAFFGTLSQRFEDQTGTITTVWADSTGRAAMVSDGDEGVVDHINAFHQKGRVLADAPNILHGILVKYVSAFSVKLKACLLNMCF